MGLAELAAKAMADWETRFEIVSQVRGLGLLMAVSFQQPGQNGIHIARSVRDEMLRRGVWALRDFQPQVRMYPALNMSPEVFKSGLAAMEAAIAAVARDGPKVGDYPPMPSGNVGF